MEHKRVELTPKEIDEQIRSLMSEKYVAPDYLRLSQALFQAQYETQLELRAEDLYPPVSTEEANERINQGLPVIEPDKLQFNEAELAVLLQKICSILAGHVDAGYSIGERLEEAVRSRKVNLGELAEKAISDDEEYLGQVSETTGEGKEEIIFLATALAAPFLRICAQPLSRKVDLDSMRSQWCPICGGAPLMAKLRQGEGKRILECSLCNTQWAYKRLQCPFCGNEDQDSLGFFFTEEESAYRVDKCDRCKRYIKTVDERKRVEGESRLLLLEDVATIYLDMLAEKEGYQGITKALWKEGQ